MRLTLRARAGAPILRRTLVLRRPRLPASPSILLPALSSHSRKILGFQELHPLSLPDAAAAAAAASGEPARASAASGPHSRGPVGPPPRPLGGRAHAHPSATTTTPGKGALTKRREAAGRRAAGRGPQGPRGLGGSRLLRALGPRRALGKRDPSSLLKRAAAPTHSLRHPPSLLPSPEATELGRCPGSPPFPTPLPSSRQTSQPQISRDFLPDRPDPARDTTACARGRATSGAREYL